jgi:hypothetical protein
MLWRLLFPSWAFFDRVSSVPRLETRSLDPQGTPSRWQAAMSAPRRGAGSVLYHPAGTVHLAMQSLVERCAAELDDDITDATTQALVESLARWTRRDEPIGPWQWRVVLVEGQAPRVLYTSEMLDEHHASAA